MAHQLQAEPGRAQLGRGQLAVRVAVRISSINLEDLQRCAEQARAHVYQHRRGFAPAAGPAGGVGQLL